MKGATVELHSYDDFRQVQNEAEPALPQLSGLEVTKQLTSLANNAADSRVGDHLGKLGAVSFLNFLYSARVHKVVLKVGLKLVRKTSTIANANF